MNVNSNHVHETTNKIQKIWFLKLKDTKFRGSMSKSAGAFINLYTE